MPAPKQTEQETACNYVSNQCDDSLRGGESLFVAVPNLSFGVGFLRFLSGFPKRFTEELLFQISASQPSLYLEQAAFHTARVFQVLPNTGRRTRMAAALQLLRFFGTSPESLKRFLSLGNSFFIAISS
jgi:hypothetical protein